MDKEWFLTQLTVIGKRRVYQIVARKYLEPGGSDKDPVVTEWFHEKGFRETVRRLYARLCELEAQGYTVWISLYRKKPGVDSILGVTKVSVLWFDFDAEHPKERPANWDELKEAYARMRKLKDALYERYRAWGFVAFSGNGYHLYYPLPGFPLRSDKKRIEFNQKLQTFVKKLNRELGVNADKTYDLRRVVSVIGSLNQKIPGRPIKTKWLDSDVKRKVRYARKANVQLLKEILKTQPERPHFKFSSIIGGDVWERLERLRRMDEKLNRLLEGDWQALGFPSRSEAEMSVVVRLALRGFTPAEVVQILDQKSKIGKWQEEGENYRERTIRRGFEFVGGLHEELETSGHRQEPQRTEISQ